MLCTSISNWNNIFRFKILPHYKNFLFIILNETFHNACICSFFCNFCPTSKTYYPYSFSYFFHNLWQKETVFFHNKIWIGNNRVIMHITPFILHESRNSLSFFFYNSFLSFTYYLFQQIISKLFSWRWFRIWFIRRFQIYKVFVFNYCKWYVPSIKK